MTDIKTVITLFGNVAVTFNEEGPNTLNGAPAALRELDRALMRSVNRWGIGVTAQAMNPDDLEFIADTPGSGIGVAPAADPDPTDGDEPPPPEQPPEKEETMLASAQTTVGVPDGRDDFSPEDEFASMPEDEDETPVFDGDFRGHPFRGNQHRKASRQSGAAVNASIKAKAAERKGDHKAAASAHRSAHHSHMAAAEETTGETSRYHKTMAKFHDARAGTKLDGVLDDAEGMLDAAEGAYLGKEKRAITATASLLRYLREFIRSESTRAKNPLADDFSGAYGFASERVINKHQAQEMLTKLIDIAVGRKAGVPDMTAAQAQRLSDFRFDARVISDYFDRRIRPSGGRNHLRTPEMKKLYPEIDNPGDFEADAIRRVLEHPSGMLDGALDAVTDVSGLRAQVATATGALAKLAAAKALWAFRTTVPSVALSDEPLSYPFKATSEAVMLLKMAAVSGGGAYAAATAIDSEINGFGFDGITVSWAAIGSEGIGVFDDASGTLFSDESVLTQASYLRADIAYKGKVYASIYVRGDGSALVKLRPGFDSLPGWNTLAETADEEFSSWVSGVMEAKAIGELMADFDAKYGLAAVLRDNEGELGLPPQEDPRIAALQRRSAANAALERMGWKYAQLPMMVFNETPDDQLRITSTISEDAQSLTWTLSRMHGDTEVGTREVPDADVAGLDAEGVAAHLQTLCAQIRSRVVDKDVSMEVARTIMQQLGGSRFKAMTGAKNFLALTEGNGGLRFMLPTGFTAVDGKKTGINRVFIRLQDSDTYAVEFGNARGSSYRVMAETDGIYAEGLREVFTRYTGLDTSLGGGTTGVGNEQITTNPGSAAGATTETAPPAVDTTGAGAAGAGVEPGGSSAAGPASVEADGLTAKRTADLAMLTQIASNAHPEMLEPELGDVILNILEAYPGDAEIEALGDRAVRAYEAGLMAATAA